MSHKETLKTLIPLELGPVSDDDLAVEGSHLDRAMESVDLFFRESFADSAFSLLEAWEKTYNLKPAQEDTLQARRAQLLFKMNTLGRLDRAYYIQLAKALGYVVVIQELNPFMAGWSWPGLETLEESARWCWRVIILDRLNAFR